MNIQQMMKQAQQMQERLQKQKAELKIEASAGGGMVTVVVNGAKQIQSLKIDPEVVSKDDLEMLQDLIVAAVNDAQRKVDEEMAQKMGGMMGGLKIPGDARQRFHVPTFESASGHWAFLGAHCPLEKTGVGIQRSLATTPRAA